jgi:hypothetical protein
MKTKSIIICHVLLSNSFINNDQFLR